MKAAMAGEMPNVAAVTMSRRNPEIRLSRVPLKNLLADWLSVCVLSVMETNLSHLGKMWKREVSEEVAHAACFCQRTRSFA